MRKITVLIVTGFLCFAFCGCNEIIELDNSKYEEVEQSEITVGINAEKKTDIRVDFVNNAKYGVEFEWGAESSINILVTSEKLKASVMELCGNNAKILVVSGIEDIISEKEANVLLYLDEEWVVTNKEAFVSSDVAAFGVKRTDLENWYKFISGNAHVECAEEIENEELDYNLVQDIYSNLAIIIKSLDIDSRDIIESNLNIILNSMNDLGSVERCMEQSILYEYREGE